MKPFTQVQALPFMAFFLSLYTAGSLFAAQYTIVDLEINGNLPSAKAINKNNVIVGKYFNSQGKGRAFLWKDGVMSDLGVIGAGTYSAAYGINDLDEITGYADNGAQKDTSFRCNAVNGISLGSNLGTLTGGTYSEAAAINGSGLVVGKSEIAGGGQHAFAIANQSGAIMADLGTLGGNSEATAINNANVIVGFSGGKAFRCASGPMSDLGSLGGGASKALGINDNGVIVGESVPVSSNSAHAFMLKNNQMSDLGTLGGDASVAQGINQAEIIVGRSQIADGTYHGFVYRNGAMIDLNALIPAGSGWVIGYATAINASGCIVGDGKYQGIDKSFLLVPIPVVATKPNPIVSFPAKTSRFSTSKARFTLKGTASDIGGTLTRVEVKLGQAAFKSAKGTSKWTFTAKLKPGKNTLSVRAVDVSGAMSPVVKVTVTRK